MRTDSGHTYLLRIHPYRTLEDVVDGVVLTFTDISGRVAAEAELRQARALAEGIVNTIHQPLVVLDGSLRVLSASRSFYRFFAVTREETVGRLLYDLGNRQWNIPGLRDLLENVLPSNQSFDGFVVEHDFPAVGRRKLLLNARRIVSTTGEAHLILLAIDVGDPGPGPDAGMEKLQTPSENEDRQA